MKYYLQIMRPANLITAVADILAGMALVKFTFSAELHSLQTILFLCLSTISLYGGGIVFNDVFDAELDRKERPERIIPSGKISIKNAAYFGVFLFVIGIFVASIVNIYSGIIAFSIAALALVYDKFGKHQSFLGPLNMGLCRGGNLLLGMSAILPQLQSWWWIGVVPVIYIGAITMVSRGEVLGGDRFTLYFAALLYIVVSIFQLNISFQFGNLLFAVPFVILHILLIFRPLILAIKNPIAPNIGKAVKAGVLSLIVMDAAWVAVSGNYYLSFCVLILLPISILVSKKFAVT